MLHAKPSMIAIMVQLLVDAREFDQGEKRFLIAGEGKVLRVEHSFTASDDEFLAETTRLSRVFRDNRAHNRNTQRAGASLRLFLIQRGK
jgi:hypothetical protein